jgi:hypothetical protein
LFLTVYLAAAVAALFYAIFPVIGAFVVREQWRQFRRSVIRSAALPELSPAVLGSPCTALGRFRAQGEVDAIGGQHELWIAGHMACIVDLHDAWVYVLTGGQDDCRVERLRWRALPSVGAGTTGGRTVFGPSGKDSPLVILHDGDDEDLIRRAVKHGRHGNEYWNPVTQVSLALGVAAMSGILSLSRLGGMPSLVTALTLCAAFSPILPLLPPGVVGFFLYRWLWKRALRLRSLRDMEVLDDGWSRKARALRAMASKATAASAAAFVVSFAVNAWLTVFLLRRFL